MKTVYIFLLLILVSCKTSHIREDIMCNYSYEEKPFDKISVELKAKSLFDEQHTEFDKNTLVNVIFYASDSNLDDSEHRIILFAFDDKTAKILTFDGNYTLLSLKSDFSKKPLEELKLLCSEVEKKYHKRDCEIEGGSDESLVIFKNDILQYYFYSRGYAIGARDSTNQLSINAGTLCRKLIRLAGKTKTAKKQ